MSQYWNMELSTLLTSALFLNVILLDYMIYESHMLTTFEYNYEGFGYMGCLGYASMPFFTPVIVRYCLEHGVHWAAWQLVAAWSLFLPAFYVYKAANAQKHCFRTNPYDPAVARKFLFTTYLACG